MQLVCTSHHYKRSFDTPNCLNIHTPIAALVDSFDCMLALYAEYSIPTDDNAIKL